MERTEFILSAFSLTVFLAPLLSLVVGNDLADVLDGELPLLDGVLRLHAPTAAVLRPINYQPRLKVIPFRQMRDSRNNATRAHLPSLLDDPVVALGAALAALVALVDGEAGVEAQVAVLGVREVELGVEGGAARLGRRQAARRGALAADHGVVGDHNAAGGLEILREIIFISLIC